MKLKLLSLVFLCVYAFAKAQVGIGTTTPQATLDIPASDAVAPAAEDGILIPRIDNFPATNPTLVQDGMMVFVTGNGTPTKGFYYWDNTTTSWVIISGVTGGGVTLDQAYDFGGAGAGNTITATDGTVTIDGEDGLLVSGTFGSGATTGTNVAGTYMFFNPRKAAFRAGNVTGGNWADPNVGEYSIAMGRSVIAQGEGGIALGSQANASGENAVALGRLTTASGARATAFGFNNEASGLVSTAFGTQTEATGDGATSFGILTTASGELSTAFGRSSVASGENATAFGELTDATGENATAFGRGSNATGQESTAFGLGTNATGIRSTAFGLLTTASGFTSTAFGYSNTSPSQYETTLGAFATEYTPINPNSFEPNDRLFTIGNGELVSGVELRSNALTIYKSGLMNINDAYNMPLADGTANQVMTTDGAGNVTFQDAGASGGTLDDAYDFGGAGSGNTITATDGAVTIDGEDGLLITGTFGSGETITASGAGTRMFFNPRKAAFRAGRVTGNEWDDVNVGNSSAAFGLNNNASGSNSVTFGEGNISSGARSASFGAVNTVSATSGVAFGQFNLVSGTYATAFGINNSATGIGSTVFGEQNLASGFNAVSFGILGTASGRYSSTFGHGNNSPSFAEMTVGTLATNYTPISLTSFDVNDRIFTVGNGEVISFTEQRSNALTIYKSGLMNINDAYNMPLIDGTANQVMTTDGAGNVTFQDAIAGTDDQQIDVLNLNGTNLEISLEDDGLATQTLDLSSLQDGIGTDNQQIDVLNLNGTNLEISLQDDGVATQTLDLSSLQVLAINDLTDGKTDTNNSSVYLGTGAGNNDNDALNFNTGVGANTLTSSTSGIQNTAVGSSALLLNTTGSNNVAVGQVALLDNTTGSENIAIGRNAVANNIDGNQNIGIGGQSLLNNTSSSNNIAIGYQSLNNSSTGRNIAIGTSAGSSITTGTRNVGIGYNTQLSQTSGSENVTLGDNTLDTMNSTTNASDNVAIGTDAMSNLTEGSNNVAIGNSALFGNANGAPNFANNNVAIGFQAGLNIEGNANIFIGYQAGLLNPFSNDRLFIENSGANENNALIYGEFDNDILRTNGELQIGNPAGTGYAFPVADGTNGQILMTDGTGTISFQTPSANGVTLDEAYDFGGPGAGRIVNVDNGAVQIAGNAGGTAATTPAQLILTETQANDFSRLRFTNSIETTNTWTIAARTDNDVTASRMNFNHNGAGDLLQLWGDGFVEVNGVQEIDGRLGININNPGQALILPNTTDNTLGGTLARAWTTYSDGRVKSDQRRLVNGLSLLLQTTPKTYIHHDSSFENGSLELSENGAQTFGFIAQELYEVLPEAVDKPADDTKELWSVDYDKIIPVAVKAIQELKAEKDALNEQVKKLEEKVQEYASLEARIEALENMPTQYTKNATNSINKE